MIAFRTFTMLLALPLTFAASPTLARENAPDIPKTLVSPQCEALKAVDLAALQDASTRITGATAIAAAGDRPAYCNVEGVVAPTIGFVMRLPLADWNGKFLQLGCGGYCGTTSHITQCNDAVKNGYACIVSDGGHKAEKSDPMRWFKGDPSAPAEYIVRSSHAAALAGKAIANSFYNRSIARSYFMGCSAGGVQAMGLAQRFPSDFDGIVAGGPATQLSAIYLSWLWNNRALMGKDGVPELGAAQLDILHKSVVSRCDMNDGIKDGLIGDPRTCAFNPAELLCSKDKGKDCLSQTQVDAAAKIYNGPKASNGDQIASPIAMRGSEMTWEHTFGGSSKNSNDFYRYMREWPYYAVSSGQKIKPVDPDQFDFDRDVQSLWAMRLLETKHQTDLRAFKANGSKLIMYTGWNDSIEGVLDTADYYETVERTMGGRDKTQDFYRLFIVPGANHCAGGDGPWSIGYLAALENWVEKGQAPQALIGQHPTEGTKAAFSRPIYPYPTRTRYLGKGDLNDAASFGPEVP